MICFKRPNFLNWASTFGIGLDARYEAPQALVFTGAHERSASHFDQSFRGVQEFTDVVFGEELGGKSFYLLRRGEVVGDESEVLVASKNSKRSVLKRLIQLEGWRDTTDALCFDSGELASAVLLAYSHSLFGQTTRDDLFVVPADGAFISWVSYYGSIYNSFRRGPH